MNHIPIVISVKVIVTSQYAIIFYRIVATPIAINIHQVLYHRGSLFLSVFLFAGCDIQAWKGLKQLMGDGMNI